MIKVSHITGQHCDFLPRLEHFHANRALVTRSEHFRIVLSLVHGQYFVLKLPLLVLPLVNELLIITSVNPLEVVVMGLQLLWCILNGTAAV